MASPIPMDYLQPDERPLITEGRHMLSLVDALIGLTVLIGILVAADVVLWVVFDLPEFAAPILVSLLVLYAWGVLVLYWRVKTSRYVITADRVYRSHGRLRFRLLQTTYDKVTDMHVRQSLFGRLWGFGDVTVQTAGTGLTMEGVREPYRVKRHIEGARTAFLDRLIEEHRLETTARAGAARETGEVRREVAGADAEGEPIERPAARPVPRGEARVIWKGRPVFVSLVSGLVSAVFMLVIGLGVGATALATGTLLMYGISGLMLFASLSITLGVWVQYNFTRYEVADWGVVVVSGWLTRKRVEATYAKVTDVTTYQGVFGRLFDFGNITINTAGSNQAAVTFTGLSKPEMVKRMIDEARSGADQWRRGR